MKSTPPGEHDHTATGLKLGFALDFADLGERAGLQKVDAAFLDWLSDHDADLAGRLLNARRTPPASERLLSELLIDLAEAVDTFVPALFNIEVSAQALREAHDAAKPLLRVKYKFVKRQAILGSTQQDRDGVDAVALRKQLVQLAANPDDETLFAGQVLRWQAELRGSDPGAREHAKSALSVARDYAAWAAGTLAGRIRHAAGVLFDHPQATDPNARIEALQTRSNAVAIRIHRIDASALHRRDGFALTDQGCDLAGAIDQAKYCLLCHRQGTDSCRRGLPDAEQDRFKRSASGEALAGCPLEERISEFLQLKLSGNAIGALAMITLDNPMVAATGHRICNDCSRACVYQKQTPVDIPQAETRVLRDVIELPWGFEIYALLTRWNPLNLQHYIPAEATGQRVLIVGAGPAGFALAHLLLNDGHELVLVDGLKIEALANDGQPIHNIGRLAEPLDTRIAQGFGGVAEYGITVRWDKNFLALIRRLLSRRQRFSLIGGVRFGGTIGTQQAWQLGFDHVALATGAGRPNWLNIPNGLAPGVRAASDFLMALQLTGAARDDSLANLQIRLPVIVIGGGLTAIDTATEAMAYYIVQVEKFLRRHRALGHRHFDVYDDKPLESENARVFIEHGLAIEQERARAKSANEAPKLIELLRSWGGVTIAYRKRIVDAPAWRLNPEELGAALAEGIELADGLEPKRIELNEHGSVAAVCFSRQQRNDAADGQTNDDVSMAAGAVFVAAGTHANAILADEESDRYQRDGDFFAARDQHNATVPATFGPKPLAPEMICARETDGRTVSFLGDAHPGFAGNVVKALASAKHAAPIITKALKTRASTNESTKPDIDMAAWHRDITRQLSAHVHAVTRLAFGILEVVVHAPAAAQAFQPGQFYRLQNFETLRRRPTDENVSESPVSKSPYSPGMEGLALTGAWVDKSNGLVGLVILENGGSANLCADLQIGEPLVLMGPTGTATEIVDNQTVVLIGGGLGNAVLFSIGRALRQAGCKVLYFAAYQSSERRFRVADIEAAADAVVWCFEQGETPSPSRPADHVFRGNVVQAMRAHAAGSMPQTQLSLCDADRLMAIGSDKMMAAVAHLRSHELSSVFKPELRTIASINSPMQCMMKEICGQCVQQHRDPDTGEFSYVFSCVNQDQDMQSVDFDNLSGRLSQNHLLEKQTAQWLSHRRERQ